MHHVTDTQRFGNRYPKRKTKLVEETKKEAVTESQPAVAQDSNTPSQDSEPKAGSKEYNFRQLEAQKREAERRAMEAEARLLQAQNTLLTGRQAQSQEENLPNLAPDDIPEWRQVQDAAKKIAREEFNQLMSKHEQEQLPRLAKQRFTDFDDVVTTENIQKLEQEYPEFADGLSKAKDPYSATYKIVKMLYGKQKQSPAAKEELEKLEENAKRPQSINSVAKGALSNANSFAKKPRDQLYKEMMDAANRAE